MRRLKSHIVKRPQPAVPMRWWIILAWTRTWPPCRKEWRGFKTLVKRCRTVGLVPLIDFIPNHVSRLADWDFGEGDDHHTFFSPEQVLPDLQQPGDGPPASAGRPFRRNDLQPRFNAVTWNPTKGMTEIKRSESSTTAITSWPDCPALRLLPVQTGPKRHVPKPGASWTTSFPSGRGLGIRWFLGATWPK